MMKRILIGIIALSVAGTTAARTIDRVDFGNGDGVRIKRPAKDFWRSGPIETKLKVDAAVDNYITVRLDGSDTSHGHLLMLVDGKAMGQMHLGEYDLLDYESCWPRDKDLAKADPEHAGVRTFRTFLLPPEAIRGKKEIHIAIYATGHVWGYGIDFAQFQKNVSNDSRRIYGVVIHDTPYPELAKDDTPVVKPDSAADCFYKDIPQVDIAAIKAEVERKIEERIAEGDLTKHLSDAGFLAEAYWSKETTFCRDSRIVEVIVAAMDDVARRFALEPENSIDGGSWIGLGEIADGIWRLGEEALAPHLDKELDNLGLRRQVWAAALEASFNQLFTHRRFFANQCQIIDTNCHRVNRALKICDPKRGAPLEKTVMHLKQAMGLLPCPNGYVALTAKGLSKEDGFVGSYGESTIWASCDAYEVTVDRATGKGDAELLKQIEKAVLARSYFRFPGVRRDGSRVMRLENIISWRNDHFPGMPDYLSNGAKLLRPFILTRSLPMLGALRNAWEDGWFQRFACNQGEGKMTPLDRLYFLKDWRIFDKAMKLIDAGKLHVPPMPMRGEDFVWCDSENAVVACKYGDEILYVNAYYRARGAVNNLARVHYVRKDSEFAATVKCDTLFENSGDFIELKNYFQYGWMDRLYGGYREDDPSGDDGYSAAHSIDWPPANIRGGLKEPVGKRGGRADFYHVSYGAYEIVINDDAIQTPRKFVLPRGKTSFIDVATKARFLPGATVEVPPHEARVFRRINLRERQCFAYDGAYQWSVETTPPDKDRQKGRAYLWIGENCRNLRGVVVGQQNMLEEPIFYTKVFRDEMECAGLGIVFIAPIQCGIWHFDESESEWLRDILRRLAETSGYDELSTAPVAFIGHSAMAMWPYFGASTWGERAICGVSLKGAWADRSKSWASDDVGRGLSGIPFLLLDGEYEDAEGRGDRSRKFTAAFPEVPFSFCAEDGAGHFDWSEELAKYLGMYIRKAALLRFPQIGGKAVAVRKTGADGSARGVTLPLWKRYSEDASGKGYWFFDEEMAQATQELQERFRSQKKTPILGYCMNGEILPQHKTHLQIHIPFRPVDGENGVRFGFKPVFVKKVEEGRLADWTGLPPGADADCPDDDSTLYVQKICGGAIEVEPGVYELRFDRGSIFAKKREVAFQAIFPGDEIFQRAVQQSVMTLPRPPKIGNGKKYYFVREGAATIDDEGRISFLPLPPRTKLPHKITVCEYEWSEIPMKFFEVEHPGATSL